MKKSNKLLALLLVGTLALQACGNKTDETKKDEPAATTTEESATTEDNKGEKPAEEETETEEVEVKEMTGEDLDKIEEDNKEKEKYLVIDVRSEDDYKNGHIKHAISIPAEDLQSRLAEIEGWKDKSVVVYANKADDSKEAYKTLAANGFTDLYNAAGLEDFTYTTVTKVKTVLGKEFKDLAASGDYTIIDARDAKDYDAGHMPGAINVPSDKIDEIYPTLPTDKPFLTHCYSGNKSFVIASKLAEDGHEVINGFDGTKEYEEFDLSEK